MAMENKCLRLLWDLNQSAISIMDTTDLPETEYMWVIQNLAIETLNIKDN